MAKSNSKDSKFLKHILKARFGIDLIMLRNNVEKKTGEVAMTFS